MKVLCPHCKKSVPWTPESIYRPFCSERCRVIDLGAWANGSYAIPTNDTPTSEEELDSNNDND